MAIDFSRVNISLDQFQKMASGDYNAGEVSLKSETKLVKINNHVHSIGWNTKSISHEEIMAIKNAFVNALESNGVSDKAKINEIRKELGLAPDETAPKSLAERSIKPLSRQQIREIIDRNINDINAARAEKGEKAPRRFSTRTTRFRSSSARWRLKCGKRPRQSSARNR